MCIRHSLLLAGFAVMVGLATASAADPPSAPAYQIVLRSRHAEATPNRTRDAQTGGGSVTVEQPESNTLVVTMSGSAVVGSQFHGSSAGISFDLEQDLDIVPTRKGTRPPRVGMIGRVVGTLQVTEPKCSEPCGAAEQGPATACLMSGDTNLLSVTVNSSAASCGQESSINFRDGPVESVAAAGSYHLSSSFHIGVSQGKGVFNRQTAVADFDTAPRLDGAWTNALKPFRAVPRRDFGFKLIVRVVEDAAPEANAPK
jgi:hypothetical protein